MSQSEVFRPANGSLEIRSNLANGLGPSMEAFRKTSRPSTQSSGYRFGRLSHNSFFARHNPHPGRVKHIKGLLDVPICAVADEGYFSNPRYSLNFPPNSHNNKQLQKYNLPANAINVNSQTHPINTITGLQYFIGKPMNFRVFREKAVPTIGMVPVTEAWRDELTNLTKALNAAGPPKEAKPEGRPRTSQYSATTGRLIPPPSRAMSRGGASRAGRTAAAQHLIEDPDMENTVLQMLCQILQTDDVNAVQSWLVSAEDREKTMVLDMLRSAVGSSGEYYKQYEPETIDPLGRNPLTEGQTPQPQGMAEEMCKNIDRLSLDDPTSRPPSQFMNPFPQRLASARAAKHPEPILEEAEPKHTRFATPEPKLQRNATPEPKYKRFETPEVFKSPAPYGERPKSSRSDRPKSGLARVRSPKRTPTPNLSSEPQLRYERTPIAEQDVRSQKASINDILAFKPSEMWRAQDANTKSQYILFKCPEQN